MSYGPKVYRKQGGNEMVVASGGKITVEAGGEIVPATTGNASVVGAVPVLHRIDIAAGALAETDVVLTYKTRVIDAWLVLRGAGVATTTVKVQNGATAISNAMAASGSDKDIVRCASIDDAQHEIAAGGTLRIKTETGASQPDATIYVLGVRVA